ncbi:hypothetical protein G6F63_013078 [Rhizopus arrhizus]|nr:hypothetical protein G6F63_013078 [Rhizopus arrhizus]
MRWPSIATIRSPGCSCPATAESAVNESTSAGCSQDCQYRPARIGTRRSSNPAGSCDSGRLHVAAVHRRRSQCHAGIAQRDHLAVIHPQHAVAAEQPGRGGDAADPADGRRIILLADHEHRPQQQDAQQQVGDAFLGQHMADIVAVDHHRRQRHAGALGQFPGIKAIDEGRCHVFAEGFHHLHHQLAPAWHFAGTGGLLASLDPGVAGVAAGPRQPGPPGSVHRQPVGGGDHRVSPAHRSALRRCHLFPVRFAGGGRLADHRAGSQCRVHRGPRMQGGGIEQRHGAVLRPPQQHDLGTAEDDRLCAARDQARDDRGIDLP